MKRISFVTNSLLRHTLFIFLLLSLSSCSWFTGKRTVLSGGATQSVPKSQYDQLLKKYEASVAVNRGGAVKKEAPAINIENSADYEREKAELIETVNLFDNNKKPNKTSISRKTRVAPRSYDNMAIENQLVEIRRALALIGQNKVDAAMAKLKNLEQSSVPQIKVRSKFLVAELLFRQGEYDLSMQIYEEIITKYAFSGVVLKTLGRLVVCCEKLKLTKKKDQYFSILHDFFEVG